MFSNYLKLPKKMVPGLGSRSSDRSFLLITERFLTGASRDMERALRFPCLSSVSPGLDIADLVFSGSSSRYSPHFSTAVVGHQQGSIRRDGDADRPAIGLILGFVRNETREDLLHRTGWFAVSKWNKDDVVSDHFRS